MKASSDFFGHRPNERILKGGEWVDTKSLRSAQIHSLCFRLQQIKKMMAVEIGDQNFKHCKFWLSIFKFQRLDKRLEKLGPVEHFIILSANL